MPQEMNAVELRVLGVMVEKSLTQPNAYPMTINSIRLAANQVQNRDPVMELSDADVSRALHSLQLKQLTAQAPPHPGERANKFKHRVVEVFHWDPREQAVMTELMLRGRQTAGELRNRASRMTSLQDLESVVTILEGLKRTTPVFVEELPREPGKSANRYRHLLGGDDTGEAHVVAAVESRAESAGGHAAPSSKEILERVSTLEAQVAYLMRSVSELQKQINGPVSTNVTGGV